MRKKLFTIEVKEGPAGVFTAEMKGDVSGTFVARSVERVIRSAMLSRAQVLHIPYGYSPAQTAMGVTGRKKSRATFPQKRAEIDSRGTSK